MNLDEYRRQFEDQHDRYERETIPIYYNALKAQMEPFLNIVDKDIEPTEGMINEISIRPIQIAFAMAYSLIGTKAAESEYTLLKAGEKNLRSVVLQFFSQKWANFMRAYALNNAADMVKDITDHTKERVRFALAEAHERGLSLSQQTKLIREYTLGEYGKTRARTIARTEATRAANVGKQIGAEDWANENGTVLYKKWVAREDESTRLAHLQMNMEKPVKNIGKFFVMGEELIRPGDPAGSAANTVNCRCTVQFMSERKAIRDYHVA